MPVLQQYIKPYCRRYAIWQHEQDGEQSGGARSKVNQELANMLLCGVEQTERPSSSLHSQGNDVMSFVRWRRPMPALALVAVLFLVGISQSSAYAEADDAKEHAKQLYAKARTAYNLNDYTAAMALFKQAYAEHSDPSFLFNIAQCERALGKYDDAARSYRSYLREVQNLPPQSASEIKMLISTMESAAQQQRANLPPQGAQAPRPATENTVAAVVTQPAATARRRPVYKRWWLWTAAGVVAVGVAVGIGVGVAKYAETPTASTGLGTVRF